jgi:polyribonucleotide nucleotidyltransferase
MFKLFRKELEWGGTKLVLETGKVARQADGAVMVSLGETKVLCTAVAAQSPKPGQDFFPIDRQLSGKSLRSG